MIYIYIYHPSLAFQTLILSFSLSLFLTNLIITHYSNRQLIEKNSKKKNPKKAIILAAFLSNSFFIFISLYQNQSLFYLLKSQLEYIYIYTLYCYFPSLFLLLSDTLSSFFQSQNQFRNTRFEKRFKLHSTFIINGILCIINTTIINNPLQILRHRLYR